MLCINLAVMQPLGLRIHNGSASPCRTELSGNPHDCLPLQLAASKGALHAGGHAALGLLLLGNVTFNYWHCVRTPPGTPEDLPHEARTLYCPPAAARTSTASSCNCPA